MQEPRKKRFLRQPPAIIYVGYMEQKGNYLLFGTKHIVLVIN
jgi:hypothetical protein